MPEIVAQVGKTPKSLFAEVYSAEDYQWVSCDIDNRDYDDSKVIAEFRPKSIQDLAHQTFQTGQIYQLHLEDIPEQTLDIQPYGIDILGGAEEKVGFKSYEELDVFFEHLEIYG